MNGQYWWDSYKIVLHFGLHPGNRLMNITLEEVSNSQETSIWATIPSLTEGGKKSV